ncbi:MAG: twin-arginine translocase subunit TatB [Gammaproteobacteria bacterium]|nr:twin-arginine translocase subunit TatB [Gammaproteobacteria bacterium]
MFDIGFWELAIISIVALLVMGPEKLPGLIRDVSKWARTIRHFVNKTRNEIERELTLDENSDLSNRISELDELVKNAPDKQGSLNDNFLDK